MPDAHPKYKGWYWVNDYTTYGRLTDEEKEHNAIICMRFLRSIGFTIYAAAGIVGNMWAESFMSPGQWEFPTGYDTGSGGYGLVQWTPPYPGGPNPYIEWAEENDYDWQNNGTTQLHRLQYERDNRIEFIATPTWPDYGWTLYSEIEPIEEEHETDYDAVNRAASVFVYNYLRPGQQAIDDTLANRQYHARYVFDNCPGEPIPEWLLMKMSKINQRLRG